MISYNEIRERKIIVLDGDPYLVISTHVFRKQQRKAVNQTTLRNLVTGNMLERTFGQADSVEEAFIENKEMDYIFSKNGEPASSKEDSGKHWFHEHGNPKDRFSLTDDILGDTLLFIKPKDTVTAKIFNPNDDKNWFEHIVGIDIPIKVDLEVVEAPPNVTGNTATGGNKRVKLETGLEINVPMFIEAGEIVRVNTQTKEYTERAK